MQVGCYEAQYSILSAQWFRNIVKFDWYAAYDLVEV